MVSSYITDNQRNRNIKVLMGDLKIALDSMCYEEFMGKQGLGVMNEN